MYFICLVFFELFLIWSNLPILFGFDLIGISDSYLKARSEALKEFFGIREFRWWSQWRIWRAICGNTWRPQTRAVCTWVGIFWSVARCIQLWNSSINFHLCCRLKKQRSNDNNRGSSDSKLPRSWIWTLPKALAGLYCFRLDNKFLERGKKHRFWPWIISKLYRLNFLKSMMTLSGHIYVHAW